MNKFAAAIAEQKQKMPVAPMTDIETFIQSAPSDGALTREPVVVAAIKSPIERLLDQLMAHKQDVSNNGKGKAERITISFPKEQLIKAEIIKLLLESEKEMPLAMSQVISILIDRGFDSMMKE
ncbi:hypothetical protein ATI02_4318 [Pseudomonas baetica]|uniref:Uncharacterized protein n=1 Tax=Pseudomonas baetica TaxID=674054 RepID=A0ABX4Q3G4_9PSED|nr:hypothetical protein [Pseudomonas baetica]PKA71340.1 hypothetical protein ATI02_4318 [Pseudomonas baetica]PTC19839.1 hypothetical protein C0J26_07530 [Pseudomonas baetica]